MTNYHDFSNIDMPIDERKKLDIGDIWLNRAKCKKCGDVIQSNNRHDFVWCKCKSMAVDGGSWYCKRVGNPNDVEDMSVAFNNIEKNDRDN